ncbi:YdcF family protein [Haliangium sp.]|uniref:YdcF family protein n=1 Tax=Haliangium sp. TaxID=2663208 RepID=UPI003D10B057
MPPEPPTQAATRRAHAFLARALNAPLAHRDRFRPADAIVVLGAPLTRRGRISDILEERVRAGVSLYHRGGAPVLCVTGGGPPGRVEADVMAEYALALGVPRSALRVERRSRSTEENARFSAALLAPDQCHTVWLVSQPFHLRRARALFRRHGVEPLCWHADDSLQHRQPRRALRWLLREYAALGYLGVRIAAGAVDRART